MSRVTVGRRMRELCHFVWLNPGCTKQGAALLAGPSRRFDYAAIDRCIRAGLLFARVYDRQDRPLGVATKSYPVIPGYRHHLFVTGLGAQVARGER